MRRGAIIALLIGIALAIPGIAQEHSGPPGGSDHENCLERAHRDHCDCWVHCNEIPDEAMRDRCKEGCQQTEKLEMNKCDAT